jgi:hypothetical protein
VDEHKHIALEPEAQKRSRRRRFVWWAAVVFITLLILLLVMERRARGGLPVEKAIVCITMTAANTQPVNKRHLTCFSRSDEVDAG